MIYAQHKEHVRSRYLTLMSLVGESTEANMDERAQVSQPLD